MKTLKFVRFCRDVFALWLIRLARKLTTWGFTDDYLEMAERQQSEWLDYRRRGNDDQGW